MHSPCLLNRKIFRRCGVARCELQVLPSPRPSVSLVLDSRQGLARGTRDAASKISGSDPRPRVARAGRERWMAIEATVYVNGTIGDANSASVPVFDHGFLYGEGVYETLRTYHGEPFLFDRHLKRLHRSANMMALPVPLSDAELLSRVRETMAAHDQRHGAAGLWRRPLGSDKYIRILLTRGVGELS